MSGLFFLSAEFTAMKRRVAEAEDRARRAEEEIDSLLGFIARAIVEKDTAAAQWLQTIAEVHAETLNRQKKAAA